MCAVQVRVYTKVFRVFSFGASHCMHVTSRSSDSVAGHMHISTTYLPLIACHVKMFVAFHFLSVRELCNRSDSTDIFGILRYFTWMGKATHIHCMLLGLIVPVDVANITHHNLCRCQRLCEQTRSIDRQSQALQCRFLPHTGGQQH